MISISIYFFYFYWVIYLKDIKLINNNVLFSNHGLITIQMLENILIGRYGDKQRTMILFQLILPTNINNKELKLKQFNINHFLNNIITTIQDISIYYGLIL